MATPPHEVALGDRFVAAKEAHRADPTPANKREYRKLLRELQAQRNARRSDTPSISTS